MAPDLLGRVVWFGFALLLVACDPSDKASVYHWKTTLDWTDADSRRWQEGRADSLGLRLFDWDVHGEVGTLIVRAKVPDTLEVIPVVYVTEARLAAWASESNLDPGREAADLLARMDLVLARAWDGRPRTWQLDADWTARTRDAWFAVASAFRELVHGRGARFEVTVRLHQYRDREVQGVPPADAGVLMLYGAGERVLDPDLVDAYLRGPGYPLPLTAAFPSYTQVRQLNGYGRLVALHRLDPGETLPLDDLRSLGGGRYEVLHRSSLGGRPLLARDTLVVDQASAADLARVVGVPAVRDLRERAGGRVWWFDDSGGAIPRLP